MKVQVAVQGDERRCRAKHSKPFFSNHFSSQGTGGGSPGRTGEVSRHLLYQVPWESRIVGSYNLCWSALTRQGTNLAFFSTTKCRAASCKWCMSSLVASREAEAGGFWRLREARPKSEWLTTRSFPELSKDDLLVVSRGVQKPPVGRCW